MAIFSNLIPIPEPIQNKSRVGALKKRLDWGEPALTIIDVRPRVFFNISRISGSIPLPMDEPVELTLASLESSRDIYVYAETDAQTAVAANQLNIHLINIQGETFMMITVISVLVLGWILAATIGTYAYFANEPRSKKFTSTDNSD